MDIGFVKEKHYGERRVALTPAVVKALVDYGQRVFFEKDAGAGAHFTNDEFLQAGAHLCHRAEEVFLRSTIMAKVAAPTEAELAMVTESQMLMGFQHLAIWPRRLIEIVRAKNLTLLGYELVENEAGDHPVLVAMSEIAGALSIQIAAHHLQCSQGGRGVLLGSLPGIPPARVTVLGAGVLGMNAARAALALGAQVTLIDRDADRLREARQLLGPAIITMMNFRMNVEQALRNTDVFIGAVLIAGGRAPRLVTRDMVKLMRAGTVLIDASIDQGGCVETSRPTTAEDPVYVEEGVIHCCMPNIPSCVSRTSSYALATAILPMLARIVQGEPVFREDSPISRGLYTYQGRITNRIIADQFGFEYVPLSSIT